MLINKLSKSKRIHADEVVIIIPAYNPDEKFVSFLADLVENGYAHIITVNDGSDGKSEKYFEDAEEKYDCQVIRHNINLGQGRAFKTAFNFYLNEHKPQGKYENTIGVIECDCDGQHHIEDINRCLDYLWDNPHKFILGVRDFNNKNVPFRSRFGNKCTGFVFKFFCGLDIKDTQTGLKGIPASIIPALMETPGERFEYASSCLLEMKKQGVEILQFPIKTIYINDNETSHFNPLIDSIRIYSLMLKYLASSLSSFIVDIVFFSFFVALMYPVSERYYIIAATYMAKVISCTYGFLINRKFVFESNSRSFMTAAKFFSLCVIQSCCSGILTNGFVSITLWNEVACKIIIDTMLFFISFQIQNRWVFDKRRGN